MLASRSDHHHPSGLARGRYKRRHRRPAGQGRWPARAARDPRRREDGRSVGSQCSCAAFRGQVRLRVSPFAQQGLDEALCLAVRAWRIRPRPQVPQPQLAAGASENLRDVSAPIVGHHPPHLDAVLRVPGDGPLQKAQRSATLLIVEHLDRRDNGCGSPMYICPNPGTSDQVAAVPFDFQGAARAAGTSPARSDTGFKCTNSSKASSPDARGRPAAPTLRYAHPRRYRAKGRSRDLG